MFNSSQMRLISVGYVAENKLRSTNEVEISLSEIHPFVNGELVAGITEESVDCIDSNGQSLTFKVKTSNTIRATWKGDGTNRYNSPDVRRAEMVNVYQFGDTDKYYWTAVAMPGVNTRKLETVTHVYSNTTDESQTELTAENSWSDEVNTHDGHWTRKTSKSNGEKHAYTQQINAKESNVVLIADDAGAHVSLNSIEDQHHIETASGGSFMLEKRKLTIDVDVMEINAASEFIVKTPKGIFTIDTGTWTGNLTFIGNMLGTADGTYTFNGNVITTAGLTNKNKDVGGTHRHSNVVTGSGTSGAPV